jgi:hypothetical protein
MARCRQAATFLIASTALAAAGCATGATAGGMTAAPPPLAAANSALHGRVSVLPVRGGRATNRFLGSRIGDREFEQALRDSLREAGLLAPSASQARYTLQAEILEADVVDQNPSFVVLDPSRTVTSTIHYLLTDTGSGATLLDRRIEVPYTAGARSAFRTETRNQLAQEGTARESIETLLDELAALQVSEDDAGK